MNLAIEKLKTKPEFIIVDGNKFKSKNKIPYKCIVKGDSKYMSIAAASILAKTSRDHYMIDLSKEYPHYHWDVNKGYPTKKHKKIILEKGITKYHRKTFKLN
jgi:ribonuclease HII